MLLRQVLQFLRAYVWSVLLISVFVLLPCFWHKSIEAGDLPSHTYNAWLAQLIAWGQAPGLYIQSRWDNILADLALAKFGPLTGFLAAEHIVVALAVLVFLWGAFALISVATGRPPWTLLPAIAMLAYGWTFYSGFLNFYLSVCFAFCAVSLLSPRIRIDFSPSLAIAVLALLAHPIGIFAVAGLAIYL